MKGLQELNGEQVKFEVEEWKGVSTKGGITGN